MSKFFVVEVKAVLYDMKWQYGKTRGPVMAIQKLFPDAKLVIALDHLALSGMREEIEAALIFRLPPGMRHDPDSVVRKLRAEAVNGHTVVIDDPEIIAAYEAAQPTTLGGASVIEINEMLMNLRLKEFGPMPIPDVAIQHGDAVQVDCLSALPISLPPADKKR